MAIDEITVRGFKSIRSVEAVKLRPINLLIGANGSGKSNFLETFSLLRAIRGARLRPFVARSGGAERLLHYGAGRTDRITMRFGFADDLTYGVRLEPTVSDRLYVEREWLKHSEIGRLRLDKDDSDDELAEIVRLLNVYHIARWRRYQFHDTGRRSPMRKTATVTDNRALRGDGANLPAFLRMLRQKHRREYKRIRDVVRMVAPFFRDFVLEPDQYDDGTIRLEWEHTFADDYFDTAAMSDGTLRFVALATLLRQPVGLRPDVILLDEPELGLHPYAIGLLAEMIHEASENSQVIVATQSPRLTDEFDPDDVLVVNRHRGATTLERLSASELAEWLEDYTLGELWEKNELGGRPVPERAGPGTG